MSGQRLTPAFSEFVRAVSRALYDLDPDGIGSSIDAPLDEYDDLAARLATDLAAAASEAEVGQMTRQLFVSAHDSLISQMWSACAAYRTNRGVDD